MAFSIEALQSRAKYMNANELRFTQTILTPEFRAPEPIGVAQASSNTFKSIAQEIIAKIKQIIGKTIEGQIAPAPTSIGEDTVKTVKTPDEEGWFGLQELLKKKIDKGSIDYSITSNKWQ